MHRLNADRNLLVGIVALQMDFVTRDELISAMQSWMLAKDHPLGELLVERKLLVSGEREVIEALVDRHVSRHRGDHGESLSALAKSERTRSILKDLGEGEVDPKSDPAADSSGPTVSMDPDAAIDTQFNWMAGGQRFEIVRLHDQGGLGSVFVAHDLELNRSVALKMLRDEVSRDPQCRARFLMEAEITGNLEHPGIPPVHARGLGRDGLPYYAMRFVKGQNLKDALDAFHKSPGDRVDAGRRELEFQGFLRRFLTICETVSYAHSRGVLHRDLKPRNVLLGPFGETLVVDWGLAKPMGRRERTPASGETLRPASSSGVQATVAGARLGTPAYMSPEQAKGELDRLETRTDVYGLGATLYYILAGRAPFVDDDGAAIIAKVEKGHFTHPRQINPRVSRTLEAICLKAMALKPEDRYPNPKALADDIERYLADQPTVAYPEPALERAGRLIRRNKRLLAPAALLMIAAAAGLVWHDRGLAREKAHTEAALDQVAEQLTMTRSALTTLLNVAGSQIASYPNSGELRSSLGKVVLDYYTQLDTKFPNNLDVRFGLAQTHYLLGRLDQQSGASEDSLAHYQEGLAILAPLAEEPTTQAKAIRLSIKTRIDRATLHVDRERFRAAEDEYDEILAMLARYARILDPTEAAEFLAGNRINRSEAYLRRGAFREARADADMAVGSLEKALRDLEADDGNSPTRADKRNAARVLLAMATIDRGQALGGLGDVSAAEKDYHAGAARMREIPPDSDSFDDSQYQMAMADLCLGRLLLTEADRANDAETSLSRAVETLETLARKQPDSIAFREGLVKSLLEKARLAINAGNHTAARTDIQAASRQVRAQRAASPKNHTLAYLSAIGDELEALILIREGDRPRARETVREAIQIIDDNLRFDADSYDDKTLADRLRKLEADLATK